MSKPSDSPEFVERMIELMKTVKTTKSVAPKPEPTPQAGICPHCDETYYVYHTASSWGVETWFCSLCDLSWEVFNG